VLSLQPSHSIEALKSQKLFAGRIFKEGMFAKCYPFAFCVFFDLYVGGTQINDLIDPFLVF